MLAEKSSKPWALFDSGGVLIPKMLFFVFSRIESFRLQQRGIK